MTAAAGAGTAARAGDGREIPPGLAAGQVSPSPNPLPLGEDYGLRYADAFPILNATNPLPSRYNTPLRKRGIGGIAPGPANTVANARPTVIPAPAGIQNPGGRRLAKDAYEWARVDSRFRGNDGGRRKPLALSQRERVG